MNRYNPYYYLLFVLLVFGAFASMAQNGYGITILGGVALAFGIIFLLQFIEAVKESKIERMKIVEPVSLAILSFILFMRVFYIWFPFVEVLFATAGLGLIGSYLIKMSGSWNALRPKDKRMGGLVLLFQSGILLYILSLTITPFVPALAQPSGALAFGLLITFLLMGYIKGEFLVDGEKLTVITYVLRLKDRSVVLGTLFLMFTAYLGLTQAGLLPKMYLDKFPQAYYQLVNQAESGVEKSVNGKFRHEAFKEKYDLFIDRHAVTKKK